MLIFKWLDTETEKVMRNDPEDLKLAFDNEPFLRYDAAKEVNEVNAMELLSAIEALPIKYNASPRDTLQLVLNKIPAQMKNEHWVATLENEFRRAIRMGGEMPWASEALCEEIIDNIKRSVVPKPSVRAAQRLSTTPSKTGDSGARASRLKDKVLTGTIAHRQVAGRDALILLHQKIDGVDGAWGLGFHLEKALLLFPTKGFCDVGGRSGNLWHCNSGTGSDIQITVVTEYTTHELQSPI